MNVTVRKLKYRFRPPMPRRGKGFQQSGKRAWRGFGFFAILIVLITACLFAENRFAPIIIETAAAKVNGKLTVLTNEAVTETLRRQQLSYSDLVSASRNEQGEITSLQTDVVKANQLKSDIALTLQEHLSETGSADISVPAGVLLGSQAVSGYGFKIPVKILSTELMQTELKDDFQSVGINQTKHKLWLEVCAKGVVGTGLRRQEVTVITQVPIAETVIVGSVPNFYAGVETRE